MRFVENKRLRILCWDIENKPGTYGPGDYTHGKVTAIGAQFLDESVPSAWILRRNNVKQMRQCAKEFCKSAEAADIFMGHNLRRHDIKLLNGWLVTVGLPVLAPKPVLDTYLDQPKVSGLSRSLENLCARWGCPVEKVWMPEHVWEQAYDGVPYAVEKMRERVTKDVQINIWLFHELRSRGLLKG